MCRGSLNCIHPACLDNWRGESVHRPKFSQCEVCLFPYEYERNGYGEFVGRRARVVAWVIFKILSVLAVFHLIVFGFALACYRPEGSYWGYYVGVLKSVFYLIGGAIQVCLIVMFVYNAADGHPTGSTFVGEGSFTVLGALSCLTAVLALFAIGIKEHMDADVYPEEARVTRRVKSLRAPALS